MRRRTTTILMLVPFVGALACSDEDDVGTAPTIQDLSHDPGPIPINSLTTLNGSFSFDDPDGDLDALHIELGMAGGPGQLVTTDLQGVDDMVEGVAAFVLALQPPTAGTYTFDLWVVDIQGNASNRLSSQIEAQ